MSYQKRLDQAFENVPVLPLDDNHKYVVFSDCHRGSGNNNDNFIKNEHLYLAALRHYNRMQYTYVELGWRRIVGKPQDGADFGSAQPGI